MKETLHDGIIHEGILDRMPWQMRGRVVHGK